MGRRVSGIGEAALVIALVLAGAVLRLRGLSQMEFKADEMTAVELGRQLLASRPWATSAPWPRAGMLSSVGIANAPLFNYLMALIWALVRDPVRATAVVATVNTACLYPIFRWARGRFGASTALWTLTFLSLSPFAVLYSRKLWTQDLLLPGLVCLISGMALLKGARPWRGVLLAAAGALWVSQLHQSGPIALALLVILLGFQQVRGRSRGGPHRWGRPSWLEVGGLVLLVGLAAGLWVPYLGYLLTLPSGAFGQRPKLHWPFPALLLSLARQLSPLDWLALLGADLHPFIQEGAGSAAWVLRVGGFWTAVATGIPLGIAGLWGWARRPSRAGLLGGWWWSVVAAFALLRLFPLTHYVLILAPLPALLLAGAFTAPGGRFAARERWLERSRWVYTAALLSLTLGSQLWISERGGTRGDYGVVYQNRHAQAERLARGSEGSAALLRGEASGLAEGCGEPPAEVQALVAWAVADGAVRSSTPTRSRLLCEAWQPTPAGLRYRWAMREP